MHTYIACVDTYIGHLWGAESAAKARRGMRIITHLNASVYTENSQKMNNTFLTTSQWLTSCHCAIAILHTIKYYISFDWGIQYIMWYMLYQQCAKYLYKEHSIVNYQKMNIIWGRDVMGMSHAASGSGIMNIITGGMPRHQQQQKRQQVWTNCTLLPNLHCVWHYPAPVNLASLLGNSHAYILASL